MSIAGSSQYHGDINASNHSNEELDDPHLHARDFGAFEVGYLGEDGDGSHEINNMGENVACNEIRGNDGHLLSGSAELEHFDVNMPMDNPYYVVGDDMTYNSNLMNNPTESRYLLNTELGNISVTKDDLISVGVDLSDPTNVNVTTAQSDALLQMYQDRGDLVESSGYPDYDLVGSEQLEYHVPPKAHVSERDEFYHSTAPGPSTEGIPVHPVKGDELYAYVTEHGDVSLIGKDGQSVATFSADAVRAMGIQDVTCMTDADLQSLLNNIGTNEGTQDFSNLDIPQFALDYHDHQEMQAHHQAPVKPRHSGAHKPSTSDANQRPGAHDDLIGDAVEVVQERSGTPKSAIIRYARNNGTYKVQFDDGHFEWVRETQIIRRKVGKSGAMKGVRHAGKKRSIADSQVTVPENGHYPSTGPIEKPTLIHANNGYCALCDKRIPNARPAFIVIRIPACRGCATNKALLLEDIFSGTEVRREPGHAHDVVLESRASTLLTNQNSHENCESVPSPVLNKEVPEKRQRTSRPEAADLDMEPPPLLEPAS